MFPATQFIYRFTTIDWTPEAVTAAGTIAIAFLTLVLAVGTLFLWRATRRLVQGTEKTAQAQLRAYVHITKASFRNLGGTRNSSLNIKNCGQTPAYKMRT
jgi:hypothetical protein